MASIALLKADHHGAKALFVKLDRSQGTRVARKDVLGGLIHEYRWAA